MEDIADLVKAYYDRQEAAERYNRDKRQAEQQETMASSEARKLLNGIRELLQKQELPPGGLLVKLDPNTFVLLVAGDSPDSMPIVRRMLAVAPPSRGRS